MTDSSNLKDLASKFEINADKAYFPVNTMLLYYLTITDHLTESSAQALTEVRQAIPKISALFNQREVFTSQQQENNLDSEIQFCQSAINDLLRIIDTPVIRHTIDLLFSDLYPLQEGLLLSLEKHLNEDTLTTKDLYGVLKIRSMDSIIYSTIIGQIINKHQPHPDSTEFDLNPIHWQINITLQLNDLVDAVIHAKEDLESGSATIIDIIRKILTQPDHLDELLTNLTQHYLTQSQQNTFPQNLQMSINDFNQDLISQVKTSEGNNG